MGKRIKDIPRRKGGRRAGGEMKFRIWSHTNRYARWIRLYGGAFILTIKLLCKFGPNRKAMEEHLNELDRKTDWELKSIKGKQENLNRQLDELRRNS